MFHGVRGVVAETDQENALESIGDFRALRDRDLRSLIDWITVDAATDRRKGDRSHAVLFGQTQAVAIARREKLRFSAIAAAPNRADGVDHEFRRQTVAARDPRLARRTSADFAALLDKLRSGSAMDRAVHTAAAEERGVR